MAINNNVKDLIRAVANNDIQKAKSFAKVIIEADDTDKNRQYCASIKRLLESTSLNLMEVPPNLTGLVLMEDVSMSFNENRYYLSSREKKIFDEIVKMTHVCEKLQEMKIPYLNSTLLHGPSGTGKTLFGRYLAYKLGVPFVYLNFSHLIDSLMGGTAKKLSLVFNYVRQLKCVFMLDEIDCISIRRSDASTGSDAEMSRITIALMQELDKLSNDVVLLGATNRYDRIDEALLRRFSVHHEVVPFNTDEKEALIVKFLNDINMEYDITELKNYCAANKDAQAIVINNLIRLVADSVEAEENKVRFT